MHTTESSLYIRIHISNILVSLLPLVSPTNTHMTPVTHDELFVTLDTHDYNLYPPLLMLIDSESVYTTFFYSTLLFTTQLFLETIFRTIF